MKYYLGLGTNLGDRRSNLEKSILTLKEELLIDKIEVSSIYETPALLPAQAPPDWNTPFLNMALAFHATQLPEEILQVTQRIENAMGHTRTARWAPRVIDIDILCCTVDDKLIELATENLVLPHTEIHKRAFVLDPLKDLNPYLEIQNEIVLKKARRHPQQAPAFMGVLNVTPDSFSDGGEWLDYRHKIANWVESHVQIIDLGAESTRPGAENISAGEEWQRLEPILQFCRETFHGSILKPRLSLDTRHYETALQAFEKYDIQILNDVSGLVDIRMARLAAAKDCEYVLMHSLSVPADKQKVLANDLDAISEIHQWFATKIKVLEDCGVKKTKIILDPGIGFGKTAQQSQILLQNIERFFDFDMRVLVGHSRKSFLATLSARPSQERDIESIGVSLALAQKGVNILRVHNPILHQRALQGFLHVSS